MSADRVDGGAAFPSPVDPHRMDDKGMSLRDYFAAKAMQGRLAAGCNDDGDGARFEALIAYQMADAMLAARATGGTQE